MKHPTLLFLALGTVLTFLPSCKKDDSSQLPTSFPRKQLIEQFTSQDCPYCPNGTRLIDEAVKGNESRYVRLNYYYGNTYDDFTIYPTKQLAEELNVSSLPSMMYNRSVWQWEEQPGVTASAQLVHPYYFSQLISRPAATTDISVQIKTSYDPSTRQSTITVSGKNIGEKKDITLVIMLKESGLHAEQQDSYNTWNGWEDYVHTDVVRNYLNTYEGQVLEFDGINYNVSFDYELYKSYNADNCSVVAFLIDNRTGEVLNAEETPLVSGTKGGSDFAAEGVKAVPVSDTYPETVSLPASHKNVQYLTAQYFPADYTVNGNTVIEIMMLSADVCDIEGKKYLPVAVLYVVTDGDGSTLPQGTFDFSTTGEANTALAGQRVEEEFTYYGSEFFLAKYDRLDQGYIDGYEWLLTSGTLTIETNSITFHATSLSGNELNGSFSGSITRYTGNDLSRRR